MLVAFVSVFSIFVKYTNFEKMQKHFIILLVFFTCFIMFIPAQINAQDKDDGKVNVSSLSRPEKWWAVTHIFVAFKAKKISSYSLYLTDSLKQDSNLDGDASGGQVDAFRHAVWMALLTKNMRWKKAWRLGKAHEKGNYLQYKKGKLEDGFPPDKVSSDMDFWNNDVGISITKNNKTLSDSAIVSTVIEKILSGEMKIIYKNIGW
jgi:hypothetical protein